MKKRSLVTQKQIAREAGVSQTLVSLVLSDSQDVSLSDSTRQRVLNVARDMGYVPQAAAKSLVQGRSSNIGLVLVQPHFQVFRDPYIPNIMTGLSSLVQNKGYRLIVEHINSLDDLTAIRNMLMGGEVAGIVLSNFSWAESIVTPLIEQGYPIVLLDNQQSDKYYSVSLDHTKGVTQIAQHLVSLGHERIACITYSPGDHHQVILRLASFTRALESLGQRFDERYLRYGHYDPETGYEAMQSLLEEDPRPTAVYGMNDMMALGAMHAIINAGLRVPEDIAVVGYDDMRFAAFTNPALTTVHAPEVELGVRAGKMLTDLIDGQPPAKSEVLLRTELVIRGSCGGRPAH